MKRFYLILSILVLTIASFGTVVWATNAPLNPASHSAQNFPTATFLPIDDLEYTIEEVVASADALEFSDQEVDGFSFTNMSYVSRYPQGLDWKVTITPPEDEEIIAVTLFYEFAGGGT